MDPKLAAVLEHVFKPFDRERAAQLTLWAVQELGTRALVQTCVDKNGAIWTIGESSPSAEQTMVFAMFQDMAGTTPIVTVYTVSFENFAADSSEAGFTADGASYFRETIYQPSTVWGPLDAEALFRDWEALFTSEDEPAAKLNGSAAAAS